MCGSVGEWNDPEEIARRPDCESSAAYHIFVFARDLRMQYCTDETRAKRRERQSGSVDEDNRRLNWYSILSPNLPCRRREGKRPPVGGKQAVVQGHVDGLTGCGQKAIKVLTTVCRSGTL